MAAHGLDRGDPPLPSPGFSCCFPSCARYYLLFLPAPKHSNLLCNTLTTNSSAAPNSTVSEGFPCVCGACKTRHLPNELFWPWGICSKRGSGRVNKSHNQLTHGDIDSLYVRLSLGDGVHGEAIGTTCACGASLTSLAWMQCRLQLFMLCAIGCGETSRDGGSGVFAHGGEVPHVFRLWFHHAFLVKLAISRRYTGRSSKTFVLSMLSTTRCSRPKLVAYETVFLQDTSELKPIGVATWAHTKTLPHVFERKRPTASDHIATMALSMLWVSFGHKVKASSASSEAGIRADVGFPRLESLTAH